MTSIILASTSKFRQSLLQRTGLVFSIKAASINEHDIVGESCKETALLRARAKASFVSSECPSRIVIGADQTLGFGSKCFDKPKSEEDAFEHLSTLQGHTHYLYSAISIISYTGGQIKILDEFVCEIPMTMRELSEAELKQYLCTKEWQGCVGAYQAENIGANLFTEIGGSEAEIMGLPIVELLASLRKVGINPLLKK